MLRKICLYAMKNTLGTITSVKTFAPVAALTFDDGPNPQVTLELLDLLERYNAKATFFLVGKSAKCHPAVVKKIALAGHTIANHSWDHPSFSVISSAKRRAQLKKCSRAINSNGLRLFRPPYGHQSLLSRLDAFVLGYQVITWNIVAQDWLDDTPEQIAQRVINQIRPGSIILLHDALYTVIDRSFASREPTLKAVEIILDRLKDKYNFVTIPQLLKQGRPQKQNWYTKPDRDWLNSLTVLDDET